jgi:lipid II isoglutaminyl synthase (glutamine-hydrolysing)
VSCLRVCVLYPDTMNLYADRGNLLFLGQRCTRRGIGFELELAGIGESIDPDRHDLFYLGGGQDADQRRCADDLVGVKRDALMAAAERGAVFLGICGGYQLFGRSYAIGSESLPGLGLLDVSTVRQTGQRLVGNVTIDVEVLPDETRSLAGFENHAGRTFLGPRADPLGRAGPGHGNNGIDGTEGARRGNIVGTYLHGPLLPKNVWFADWLIRSALAIDDLEALPDDLERMVHERACSLGRAS